MRLSKLAYLDKAVFVFLCINAVCLAVSTAGANVGAGGACILFLVRLVLFKDDTLARIRKVDKWILLGIVSYIFAAGISIIGVENVSPSLKFFFNNYVYRSMPMLVAGATLANKRQILIVSVCMIIGVLINNFWATIEMVKAVFAGELASRQYRFSGNMHPVHFGSILAVTIPAVLILSFKISEVKWRYIVSFVTVLLYWGLGLSGTRGAWLSVGLVSALVLLVCIHNKKKLLGVYVVVAMSIVGIMTFSPYVSGRISSITDSNNHSNSERVLIWQSAFNIYKDHPINGVGAGCYKDAYQKVYISPEAKEKQIDHAHNNVLHTLAESGTIGGCAFLFMMFSIFIRSWKKWHNSSNIAALIMFMAWLSFMIQGVTEYNIGTIEPSKFIWLFIGLYLSWGRLEAE